MVDGITRDNGPFILEEAMQLQVRSLAGEAITVSVHPTSTIQQLKLILHNNNFPPASASPNFHLFFKGSKLSLHQRISDCPVGYGDFIVLIPFVKKEPQQTQKIDAPADHSTGPVGFSESVWSDIKHDLSFLLNTGSPERQHVPTFHDPSCSGLMQELYSGQNNSSLEREPVGEEEPKDRRKGNLKTYDEACLGQTKRKRSSKSNYSDEPSADILLDILHSSITDMFDKDNLVKLMEVLDSVNCLIDPSSGNCIFGKTSSQDQVMNPSIGSCISCLCPLWLKTLLKAFAFLNIHSTALHVRQRKITLSSLMKALEKLQNLGLQVAISDVEHLALLFPKVVRIVDGEVGRRSADALLILKDSEKTDHNYAQEHATTQKIVNAMKRRKYTFKSTLSKTIKDFMMEKWTDTFSLEDLLIFVRKCHTSETGREEKSAR